MLFVSRRYFSLNSAVCVVPSDRVIETVRQAPGVFGVCQFCTNIPLAVS